MSIEYITTMQCECDRCGHTWKTRTEEVPKVCSRCKRKDWNDVDAELGSINQAIKESAEKLEAVGYQKTESLKSAVMKYPKKEEKDFVEPEYVPLEDIA